MTTQTGAAPLVTPLSSRSEFRMQDRYGCTLDVYIHT